MKGVLPHCRSFTEPYIVGIVKDAIERLLRLPAIPVFLVLGLFLLWIGQTGNDGRRSGGRPSGFAVGSRRPRRRRGRGLL